MSAKSLPYKLVKNVLTPEQCAAYRDWIERYAVEDTFRPGYRMATIPLNDIENKEIKFLQPLQKVLDKVEKFFTTNYKIEHTFGMKRLYGNIMATGAINPAHDDDGDHYDGKPEVELHYSCILMLNSDYEGGELYFEHHNCEVKLEEGDIIMFRGNAENLHGVRKVLSGQRFNIIFFYRDYIPPTLGH